MISAAPDTLAIGVADAQALKAKAARGDKAALEGAARQFESMMIGQMLKTMRETRFNDADDPMTGGESMKLYQELLDQQWAAKLSSGKGLGFAAMLVKQLERMTGQSAQAATPLEDIPSPASSAPAIQQAPQSGATAKVSPVSTAEPRLPTTNASTVATASVSSAGDRKQRFLETMRPYAEQAAEETGLPSRFILAHAALESGWGAREIKDANGLPSHNLFGIKSGAQWPGQVAQTLTTEYRQGQAMKLSQPFRAYDDYGTGFKDYAELLKSRYGAAVGAGRDADAFARGLVEGGYATDPRYGNKLKAVIASVAMAGV